MQMPKGDGTGPLGAGPLSRGGFGWCTGAGAFGSGPSTGFACRRGFWGRGPVPVQVSVQNQKELLEKEKEFLQNRLQAIDQQIENME
jgi:hypothetical protein